MSVFHCYIFTSSDMFPYHGWEIIFQCKVVLASGLAVLKEIDIHMSDHQSAIFKSLSAPLSRIAMDLSLASLTSVGPLKTLCQSFKVTFFP